MLMLRMLGRALVFAHHVVLALAALYATFFAAMVAVFIAWEALAWLGSLIRLE